MATIYQRENKDGSISWRIQIRRKGLKRFSATFSTYDQAEKFVKDNEEIYCLNPDEFDYDRLQCRRIREFFKE